MNIKLKAALDTAAMITCFTVSTGVVTAAIQFGHGNLILAILVSFGICSLVALTYQLNLNSLQMEQRRSGAAKIDTIIDK